VGHGLYSLSIHAGSTPAVAIKGSPFDVHVTGGVVAIGCTADGPGLHRGSVECDNEFVVAVRNQAREAVRFDASLMQISIQGSKGPGHEDIVANIDNSQSEQGNFKVSYRPTRFYQHLEVKIEVRGEHIPGSPFQVAVEEHPLHQVFELRSLVGVTVSVDLHMGQGLKLMKVLPDFPGARAGLTTEDFISSFHGVPMTSNLTFEEELKRFTPGDVVELEVFNPVHGRRKVDVEIGASGHSVEFIRELRTRSGIAIQVVWDRSEYHRIKQKIGGRKKSSLATGLDNLSKQDKDSITKLQSKLATRAGGSVEDLFRKMDSNNDGTVSKAELIAFFREIGIKPTSVSDRHCGLLFDCIDVDHSGTVSRNELTAFVTIRLGD